MTPIWPPDDREYLIGLDKHSSVSVPVLHTRAVVGRALRRAQGGQAAVHRRQP